MLLISAGCNAQPKAADSQPESKEEVAVVETSAEPVQPAEAETENTVEDIEKEPENIADSVFTGKIVTMDDKGTVAEAVAVKDGKIMFVGSIDDVKKYAGPETVVHDYGENAIYPGFIDGHSHMGLVATMLIDGAILDGKVKLRQNAELVKEYIEQNPGKEVYKGLGFWVFPDDEDPPTHEVLDKYASDQVPIIIAGGGGHAALLNKKAIEYFKLKDMISVYGTDGIKVDENGEPTGYVVETPRFDLFQLIPISKEELKEFFLVQQNNCIKQGFTCICDAGIVETEKLPMVSAYRELADEGKLKIKVRALCEIADVSKEPLKEVEKIAKLAEECDNEYFKITGVKVFLDGVVEALTTWTLKPYTKEAGKGDNYYGYIRWNEDRKEELTEIIKYANEKGLQVHMHAIGEGAADYGLDCYEAAYKALPDTDARNALAHLTYVTGDMPKRFADNKIIAVVNPTWSTWKPGTKEDETKVYGETEAKNMYKIKSFVDSGVVTSFHTDSSGTAAEQIFSAVTRRENKAAHIGKDYKMFSIEAKKAFPDERRGEEECIDGLTSLKCLTNNPAYLLKEENNLGSIEVGKAADFTIYDLDFTEEGVAEDVSCVDATLVSIISNGRMIFPANLF